jgi:selenocysteine lyase/cysteine desulfurase
MSLQSHFEPFRQKTCGFGHTIQTPQGEKPLVYADWIASGRFYSEIEEKIQRLITPIVANTHTETSYTGTVMTKAYQEAKSIIKKHVNANSKDVVIFAGSGMTGAINKLQRIMGFKMYERTNEYIDRSNNFKLKKNAHSKNQEVAFQKNCKPIVFITHMEHHSNHTCWLETIVDLEVINPDANGQVDLDHFAELLEKYKDRKFKIASVTAGSNVTGIVPRFHEIAKMVHKQNGFCFVDFACAAPYVDINMHPEDPLEQIDAVFLSPHKFLGGPGTPGIVVFNADLYHNRTPDVTGGGTVVFTNPWTVHDYIEDIETREDGGTPPFIQGIRAAMVMQLKDQMDPEKIHLREKELIHFFFDRMEQIPGIKIMAGQHRDRLGVISFTHDFIHYNLFVKLLNDYYGIQVRGGCACAGTYGHYLLNIGEDYSFAIREDILKGNQTNKPGWIRLSVHPTMTNEEAEYIVSAFEEIVRNYKEWSKDYTYLPEKNEFLYIGENESSQESQVINELFYTNSYSSELS